MAITRKTTEPTATEIFTVAAAAHNARSEPNSNEEVFIFFIDEERKTQAITFISADAEDENEEMEMCLEEISEGLQENWRPICVIVGVPDETGEIAYMSSIIPLRDEPTLDDQAVMWELTETEESCVS